MEKTYTKKWIKKYRNNRVEAEYEVIEEIETQEVIKDGIYREYNLDGQLASEMEYKNGILHGKCKYYSEGELIKIGRYLNGVREGKWIEYSREKNYVNGEVQKKIVKNEIENKIKKSTFLNSLGKLLTGCIIGILLILAILIFKVKTSSTNESKDLLLQHEQPLENKTSNISSVLDLKYE